MKKLNIENLNGLVDDGYLRKQIHPSLDLTIWNYTNKTQYESAWGEHTLNCRGLVTDSKGNVINRVPQKFFNYQEVRTKLPKFESYRIFEKLDGSMISIFWYKDEWIISSRGSFTSPQADMARHIATVGTFYDRLNKNYCYCFELIHPQNRIVVDYGKTEDLILFYVYEKTQERELNLHNFSGIFKIAKELNYKYSFKKLTDIIHDNEEGFVILLDNGYRFKIKGEEYCRLHKIVTNCTYKDVWRMLRDKETIDINKVPDEWLDWFYQKVGELYFKFRTIKNQVKKDFDYGENEMNFGKDLEYASRKDMALYFQKCNNEHLLFAMVDGKDVDLMIWEMLEPHHEKAFMM